MEINEKNLVLSIGPHVKSKMTTKLIMLDVLIALIPTVVAAIIFFGLRSIFLIAACVCGSVLGEYVSNLIRKKKNTLNDYTAIITGVMLALVLPPAFPLWMGALGGAFGIIFGKSIFGGLGMNIFNPALIGRAFLQAAYPTDITTWSNPVNNWLTLNIDTTTAATPLAAMKSTMALGKVELTPYIKLFVGNCSGSLGETSALAIILGAIYLFYKKIIDWRIPTFYIGTVFLFSAIFWFENPMKYPTPLFQILAGGLLFGAFFMATDMVTTPVTKMGRIIFGIGAGIFVTVVRLFGGLPEGVMYSILFMNAFTPLIDKITIPRVFGYKRVNC